MKEIVPDNYFSNETMSNKTIFNQIAVSFKFAVTTCLSRRDGSNIIFLNAGVIKFGDTEASGF